MNFLILAALVHLVYGVVLAQEHEVEHHERATSYQNIHIEHFHPVPTYIKKEDSHFLKNPISLGTSSSKLEVHHGDKHDHGYAFADTKNELHGHGFEGFDGLTGGHESAAPVNYQVHDQEDNTHHYQEQFGEDSGLGHYQLSSGVQGFGDDAGHAQYEHHE